MDPDGQAHVFDCMPTKYKLSSASDRIFLDGKCQDLTLFSHSGCPALLLVSQDPVFLHPSVCQELQLNGSLWSPKRPERVCSQEKLPSWRRPTRNHRLLMSKYQGKVIKSMKV